MGSGESRPRAFKTFYSQSAWASVPCWAYGLDLLASFAQSFALGGQASQRCDDDAERIACLPGISDSLHFSCKSRIVFRVYIGKASTVAVLSDQVSDIHFIDAVCLIGFRCKHGSDLFL